MRQHCPDCQRLWRAYAVATTTHVELENALRQLAKGSATMEALTREVASAARVRETARQAIQKHEAAAHDTAGRTAGLDA